MFEGNRLCALLGIEYPVIQGGMVWAAGWQLAAAVSQAGGLGLLGSGSMRPDELDDQITRMEQATCRPWGVNIPLASPYGEDHVATCIRRGVKVVVTAAGNPATYTRRLKEAGAVVLHVVPSAPLAQKAQAAGCDAVIAEGTEAGGHNGRDLLTSMVLWPAVARAVRVPAVGAGGVADGRGLAAALALGMDGVQVGTRFAVTRESTAHDAYKQACVQRTGKDARLYNAATMPVRSLYNSYVARFLQLEYSGAAPEELAALRGKGRSRTGMVEGDVEEGELVAGQVCELIDDIPSVADVMRRMVREFRETAQRLARAAQDD